MYAVFDLETTGLSNRDRVVEIAIAHLDGDANVTDRWATLVNPRRDLGPQHVHRIRAVDARLAPAFEDVAGEVVERLAGRIPVAHNIAFDARILAHEYARLGRSIPNPAEVGICTMSWAAHFLPGAGRSLRQCCLAAGIANERPHEAMSDVLATSDLFALYLASADVPPPWDHLRSLAAGLPWPACPGARAEPVRRGAAPATPAARCALARGDIVVLTGAFAESKGYWADRLAQAGIDVAPNVTRRTALVVAADADSMSGKAAKARRYGIPVVGADAVELALAGLR